MFDSIYCLLLPFPSCEPFFLISMYLTFSVN
uniref:Uncharacterized protein n=1 Tax=Rhizophora mucronata TaxID=61149 RepID=A0A2P2MP92_RHIMU